MRSLTNSDLEAYLSEELPIETATEIEEAIRNQPELKTKLLEILARRDAGVHTLGEIWRRHRVSCPTRSQLQQYLLGVIGSLEEYNYITFHLETIRCRWCLANIEDLKQVVDHSEQNAEQDSATTRRRKYFQSSVGGMRKKLKG